MSTKRARTSPSPTPSINSSPSSSSPSPTPKISRTDNAPTTRQLVCTLPPTCNPPHNSPTRILDTKDLESHYSTYHAHVCEEKGCGCVFPDARLLELHQTECHDPIAAVRKERGEKTFACHLPTCPRLFATPKARRLHLIQAHGFPKEYFFAVTNKGVGGLLKRWGEGASLLRGEWKGRSVPVNGEGTDDAIDDHDGGMEDGSMTVDQGVQALSKPVDGDDAKASDSASAEVLTNAMASLALIPSTVRFGRGGNNAGFRSRGHGGHQHQSKSRGERDASGASTHTVQVIHLPPTRGRGRGRGAGRGGRAESGNLPDRRISTGRDNMMEP